MQTVGVGYAQEGKLGGAPGRKRVQAAHLGGQDVPHFLVDPSHAVVEGLPALHAGRPVQEAEAVAWAAGAGAAPQEPRSEPRVRAAQTLQLAGLQHGVHGLRAQQVVDGQAQLRVRGAQEELCVGTGRPCLVITCLALIHTAGPQKGPPSRPCWSRAGPGDPVGRQGPGPGQGLLGQGWGRDPWVGRGGPGCPRSVGLGGLQVGPELTCGAGRGHGA